MATKETNKAEETKDLAIKESQAIDTFAGFDEFEDFKADGKIKGLENLDATDMKLPKYKLIQATSSECTKHDIPAGTFYNTVTKEYTDTLECTFLTMQKSRVMWKKPFKRGEEPLCKSFDARCSFDGKKACGKCENQDWNNIADGDNKPACNMSYVFLGVDKKDMPFRIIAPGSSVSPTKDFLNKIALRSLPLFVYKLKLSAVKESNDQGVFYVIKYDIVGPIDGGKEKAKKYEEMSKTLADLFSKAIEIDTIDHDGIIENGNGENSELY